MKRLWTMAVIVAAFSGGFLLRGVIGEPVAHAQGAGRVFELRTYTTNPDKLGALNTRFRDHTVRLFEKHGMTNVGYWVPTDGDKSKNTLVYILSHKSREAATQSWAAFGKDPEWQKVAKASEEGGPILAGRPESVFLQATDYSPMK
jgi:hypothetical protein